VIALRRQKGVTLLEIMLVLAISSAILVLGMRMYVQFENRGYVEQAKYNIDTLFQAMTEYYHAQCASGTLFAAPTNKPYVITLAQLAPYLPNNWESKNPITQGYALQFNPTVSSAPVYVNACVVTTKGTPCVSQSTALSTSQANIVIWNEQVALQAIASMPQAQINAYQSLLAADCVSTVSGGVVQLCPARAALITSAQNQVATDKATLALPSCTAACQTSTTAQLTTDQATLTSNLAGGYLVWQRLPSATGSKVQSDLWLLQPLLQEFTLQYTHDQMLELNNGYGTPQNYLCGG
jgi:prepilin-type N-terminal cleavage/methylation domain-containing protein